jgi:hypothetical protein
MKLKKLEFDKSELLKIPELERNFFIHVTCALNEISTLYRCIWYSFYSGKSENKTVNDAQSMQTLFFVRILAGKLCEAYKLTKKGFWGSGLSNDYLDVAKCDDIAEIKKYFNDKKNLIYAVRNKFAFHYDTNIIAEGFDSVSDTQKFEILVAESEFNCKYAIYDFVMIKAIANILQKTDTVEALDNYAVEILQIGKYFITFLGNYIAAVLDRYLMLTPSDIEIPDPPTDIIIPSFIIIKDTNI